MSDAGSQVERFYDRWAALYDLVATRFPGVGAARARAADALDLAPGDTVVEMGCGTGANFPYLRERVGPSGRVVGLDLTRGVLRRARARVDREGWENVHVVRADAGRPPIDRADAVLATFVVGMFEDPEPAIEEWLDLLDSGGRVALLDAVPRDRSGPLDAAFRLFVALGAPPTGRLRYETSPAEVLGERTGRARRALARRADVVVEERSWLSFLRLTAGRV